MQQGVGANNFLAQLLGLQGGGQAGQAYDQFKGATGYNNIFNEAMRGTTNSAAGRGLLGSGSTARALQTNAGNLAQGSFGNFLQQLQGLSGQGLQAGSLVSGAGQKSSSTQGSSGLLGALGAALPLIPGIGTALGAGASLLGGGSSFNPYANGYQFGPQG